MTSQKTKSLANLGILALGIVAMAANMGHLTMAYAQPVSGVPQVQPVSGKYANSDTGLDITLPDGWSGMATTSGKYESVIVAPGGFGIGHTSPTTIMAISIITKNSTAEKTLPDSTRQPPNTQGQQPQCTNPTVNQVTINGMSGVLTTIDCIVQGQTWKMKDYFFQTNEKFIAVEFIAKTESDFSQNVGPFDSSANTLTIQNTIEAPSFSAIAGQGNGLALGHLVQHKERVHFANNKDMDLSFDTTSNITGFNFDEGSRKVMFKVSGVDGTNGTTVIHIGSLLKGPYVVTFDGAAMTNFDTATDNSTGDTTITLHYHHSTHDVTVSGTQVVPEFPLPAVAGIAAVVGVVAILGRTRLRL